MSLVIYGASDDCIEIEGDVSTEVYADDEGNVVACSDGTLLSVTYDSLGYWRISVVSKGMYPVEKLEATDEGVEGDGWPRKFGGAEVPSYSEAVLIATPPDAPMRWAVVAPTEGAIRR